MRFSFFYIAAAFAIVANAEDYSGSDLPKDVIACFNSISDISEQFFDFADAIDRFKPSDNYTSLHEQEQIVENQLMKANKNCCAPDIKGLAKLEDDVGYNLFSNFTTSVTFALIIAEFKRYEFIGNSEAISLIYTDIGNLANETNSLLTCVENKTSPQILNHIKIFNATLSEAFDSALYSYEDKNK